MAKKKEETACCDIPGGCRVEAVVGVDERGQMVLPKELRERSGIKPGDKLAVVTWAQGGGCPCILLIKADEMAGMVKNMLGPMLGELGAKS